MDCKYACGSPEHSMGRRSFLGGVAAGLAGGLGAAAIGGGGLVTPAFARHLESTQRRVLVVFLSGGVSQLETWDPKPGTDTGGPFRAIPTTVPGVHVSELLPCTARQMHHLALVRSVNTGENDHGKGSYLMTRGRRREASTEYPHLGAVCAKTLNPPTSPLPGYIRISPGGSGGSTRDSAYLGPKYDGIVLGGGKPPRDITRPGKLGADADARRNEFRRGLDERFLRRRRTAATEAYTYSYEQARRLMERRRIFDTAHEPPRDRERYGSHDFGRHCLLARRLLENGVTFVQVSHTNYDTHFENFNYHIEQLGEFDRPFATLIEDLHQRGILQSTLVVVMSEFGRTPRINATYGRDHWGKSWSVALGGCGIQAGAVIGKTNRNGTEVADRQVDHGDLFHTYMKAVGVDSSGEFEIGGRPLPIADPARAAIEEVLA